MIEKIISRIVKNPSKVRPWLASVIHAVLLTAGSSEGWQHSHRKVLQFTLAVMFGNGFSSS